MRNTNFAAHESNSLAVIRIMLSIITSNFMRNACGGDGALEQEWVTSQYFYDMVKQCRTQKRLRKKSGV